MKNPIATIYMGSGKKIVFELYPDAAPNACRSFITLANSGCFDHWVIDRVVPGFVIEPSYSDFDRPECRFRIAAECAAAGFDNPIHIEEGVVALGGDGETYASGSDFFITLGGCDRLDGRYPAFGRVIEGWDEVKRLESVLLKDIPSPFDNIVIKRPVVDEVMKMVCVETFGAVYDPPEKME